jgi:hypothetical protein
MRTRTKILLSAAAVAAAAAGPARADDALVVSPIEGPSAILPPEPGSQDPLPGSDAWIAAQVTQAFLSNRSAVAGDAEVDVRDGVVRLMNDAAVTARVKAALLIHHSRMFDTKVRTKDGVVALRGRARCEAERDRIGRLVMELDGVSGVDNRMTLGR